MNMLSTFTSHSRLRAFIYSLLLCLTGGLSQPAGAAFDPVNDDTDIFLANPNLPADRPNILLYVDNTANWNQPFFNEKAALVNVVNSLDDSFNVGLMLFPETGAPNDNTDGGYVRFSIRQMTAANKAVLAGIVNDFDQLDDAGNNNTLSLGMVEVYRYYAGIAERASNVKVKTDYANNTNYKACSSCSVISHPATAAGLGDFALASNGDSALYTSPIDPTGCSSNYLIYISNGLANENAAALAIAESELSSAGYDTTQIIDINPAGQEGNWMDEWAKFLATGDINGVGTGTPHVFTYTLEVNPVTTGGGPDMTALMQSVANNGKGQYFSASDANGGAEIEAALKSIFSQIQAVNSVFAAVTLPVSVNVRGTNLNQVYIGVFRPDANKKPRWFGNLKMYQLGFNTTTNELFLADANGNNTENPTTGFIIPTAESFWTEASIFWGFRSADENGAGGVSDLPDGDLVEKGGAAQQLRTIYATGQSTRSLYTCTTGGSTYPDCDNGSSLSATPFKDDNDSITATGLELNTNIVTGLTAFVSQNISALTDTRSVTSADTTAASGGASAAVTLASSTPPSPQTATITSLTNASPQTITALNNIATGPLTITNAQRVGSNQKTAVITTSVAHGFGNGTTVFIWGVDASDFNGTWTTSSVTATEFTITKTTNFSVANPGVASAFVATTTTTLTMTVTGHGFTVGQQISISGNYVPADTTAFGATISITGTYSVATAPDANTITVTAASASPPVNTGSAIGSVAATAAGGTTVATGTTSAAHGFTAGTTHVRISGATPTGYNVTDALVISVPTATTFTYTVPAGLATTATGSITAKVLVNNPTVTATGVLDANFIVGATVDITGSSTTEYNGSYTIVATDSATFFTYALTSGYVPAISGVAATASIGSTLINSGTVTAIIPNHKFLTPGAAYPEAGVSVVIDGDTSGSGFYNGTVSATIVDADTITYPVVSQTGCTVGSTTLCPATGTITARLASETAFATILNHDYGDGDGIPDGTPDSVVGATFTITIKGATPTDYNLADVTATVVDADTFRYPLSTGPLGDANGVMTANLKTTTATATAIAHGLTTGDHVAISGATPNDFNTVDTIVTVVDGDTFTYTLATAQGDATGNITVAAIGGAAATAVANLINWVRGADNLEDENADGLGTDARASIHGDVLHSRPAVVNYNRHGNDDDVYIFYGANDGVFRAAKGGFSQSALGEPTPGEEAWGFIPPELFGDLKRVRNNSPIISSDDKKPYFMDGSLGVYTLDANNDKALNVADGDKVHIYISTHRGGGTSVRFLYALDVSDPLDPVLLWKHSNADPGWGELGQTWSVPQVHTIKASTNPVLIFGAGYDPTVEDQTPECIRGVDATTGDVEAETYDPVTDSCNGIVNTYIRTMGRGIFVVDAITGDILWSAGPATGANAVDAVADHPYVAVNEMIYAMPSDVAMVADRFGAVRNRAYIGDTGGNMWRIDMNDVDVNNWTVTLLASIQDPSGLPGDPGGLRKFMFPPDVVNDPNGYDAVLIGSGDREHPFDLTVVNRFYMFKDYGIGTTPSNFGIVETDLFDATANCIQVCTGATQTSAINDLANAAGWFITLGTGEKNVGSSITLNNVTFFNTNQPTEGFNTDNPSDPINVGGSCGSDLGVARQYQIRYDNAIAVVDQNVDGSLDEGDRVEIHPGGGYLPSPVPLTVIINGTVHEGVLSGTAVSEPPGTLLGARLRKYWYKEFE